MALNFPTGSTLNQLYASGDRVWSWNGFAWEEKKTFVNTFNGSTGAVGISAGSNVTIIQTGNTYTISSSQINIDGGRPDEIYGGIETINGGNVNGI
jgi:hypothetical protein